MTSTMSFVPKIQTNPASQCLGLALRQLPAAWQEKLDHLLPAWTSDLESGHGRIEYRELRVTEQATGHMREELLQGRWSGTMPGKHQLAEKLGINNKTVEVALRQLESEGLLVAQGAGRKRLIQVPEVIKPRFKRVAMLLWRLQRCPHCRSRRRKTEAASMSSLKVTLHGTKVLMETGKPFLSSTMALPVSVGGGSPGDFANDQAGLVGSDGGTSESTGDRTGGRRNGGFDQEVATFLSLPAGHVATRISPLLTSGRPGTNTSRAGLTLLAGSPRRRRGMARPSGHKRTAVV